MPQTKATWRGGGSLLHVTADLGGKPVQELKAGTCGQELKQRGGMQLRLALCGLHGLLSYTAQDHVHAQGWQYPVGWALQKVPHKHAYRLI